MNLISLLDEQGGLSPIARNKLDVLAFFPEDALSWVHAWRILELEYQEWLKLSPEKYRISRVAATVVNAAARRSQQVWVAGLVALAYFGHHATGETASLNKAVNLVSAHTSSSVTQPFVFFSSDTDGFVEKDVRLQADAASIRQIFKKYRNAAHICAARVCCVEYLEPLRPFEPAQQADRCYLATAIFFQDVFDRQMKLDWGLRLVSKPEGLSIPDEALLPTEGLMTDLLGEPAKGT